MPKVGRPAQGNNSNKRLTKLRPIKVVRKILSPSNRNNKKRGFAS